jgi:hypothetical protein
MEQLFGAMCRNICPLPGESFVGLAGRWIEALHCAAALKPRDQQEWRRAAEVTMQQFYAAYSLVMRRNKGITGQQRMQHGQNFLRHAKAMHDARLRYDLLRTSGTA